MLTRKQLESLIKAWPDENGVSSDPETYDAYRKAERQQFIETVVNILGDERLEALSEGQVKALDRIIDILIDERSIYEVSNEEIIGHYEAIQNNQGRLSMVTTGSSRNIFYGIH